MRRDTSRKLRRYLCVPFIPIRSEKIFILIHIDNFIRKKLTEKFARQEPTLEMVVRNLFLIICFVATFKEHFSPVGVKAKFLLLAVVISFRARCQKKVYACLKIYMSIRCVFNISIQYTLHILL